MRSGRGPIWIGPAAVLALALVAPHAGAQPVRRVAALDEPFSGTAALPADGTLAPPPPVPPRTAYQPPRRDPNGAPFEPDFTLPDGSRVPVPQSKTREIRLARRYGTPNNLDSTVQPDGSRRFVLTGGWVVNVAAFDGTEATEFAADDIVIWVRGMAVDNVRDGFRTAGDGKTEVEVYMGGNIIIRSTHGPREKPVTQTLRAEEVFYDVERNRAIAVRADLEMATPNSPDPFRLKGEEIRRLDLENWEMLNATMNASKLPSDAGLRLDARRFTLSQRKVIRRNVFGIPFRDFRTGETIEVTEQLVTGKNVVTRLAGVPVFYLPTVRTDASDPLGPLENLGLGQSRQFGTQFTSTWSVFDLIALRPPPDHRWLLDLDYMSKRGPAAGTDYTYRLPGAEPGEPDRGVGFVKLYYLAEKGFDLLGADRGADQVRPPNRGRAIWRHQQEVADGLYFQGQLAYLSDKNFLEQFYKQEFDLGPNQETFAYLAWQRRNFGATALAEARINREFVSETNALPRVDAHLIGQTFFSDRFVYDMRASAGYFQSRPSEVPPFALLGTDRRLDTGRFNLSQELSAPLELGPLKLAPYGVLDLTEYTNELTGNEIGRVVGGGGARASVPFSRLYGDVTSELLNLRGLYHKAILGANYRYVRSNEPYNRFPLLDRLNDDAIDQSWRNMTPFQPQYVPGPDGPRLAAAPGYSPYNPQLYAIRRAVENRTDTLDSLNVLQMDLRQRFQTKRGYPGMEHTVDFFTADVSASWYPDAKRDNFGHPFAFLEFATVWNVGDRTSVVTNGWFEPYQGGSQYWNAGVYLNRNDRTNLYIGYRQTDPLNSKAVNLSVGYQLSPRYYFNAGVSYDFGLSQALSNSVTLTRTGTDLTVSVGFTYTAFVNAFGFQFLVIPNLAAGTGNRVAGPLSSNR
ncbi:MAG: LPS assembly protein LptD [Planctomycetes bacterium]|nr:LPS assembly protein LptD [Planctomycetota bacterium]